jgi:hypothetical protein
MLDALATLAGVALLVVGSAAIVFANLGRPSPAFHAHPVGPDYWFVKTG